MSPQPPVDGRCDECGFDYDSTDLTAVVATLRRQADGFTDVLTGAGERARRRPDPDTWSALEYACHVRDVLAVQLDRIVQTLAVDHPTYAPMNREQRLQAEHYDAQDPAEVGRAVAANAAQLVVAASALDGRQLSRTGVYNYPRPTERPLDWLVRHTAHEVQHHRGDVDRVLSLS